MSSSSPQFDPHSFAIATYALCGFANFSSIAIQVGGIGALAPSRKSDLARLGELGYEVFTSTDSLRGYVRRRNQEAAGPMEEPVGPVGNADALTPVPDAEPGPNVRAEFERAMIRERTLAGLAIARAEGRVGGRRKKLDAAKRREIAESVIAGRKSGADMARLYNISQPTVSRIVSQHRNATH